MSRHLFSKCVHTVSPIHLYYNFNGVSLCRPKFIFVGNTTFFKRSVVPCFSTSLYKVKSLDSILIESQSDPNWSNIKTEFLSNKNKKMSVSENNFASILLKKLVTEKKWNLAHSFVDYLHKNHECLNLGTLNAILKLYFQESLNRELTYSEKSFVLETYKDLINKYDMLDYMTSESLIHSLCAIGCYDKALKILKECNDVPSNSAFSIIISTLFKHNKKTEALNLIELSHQNNRALLFDAYKEWVHFIIRNHKSGKTKTVMMAEEIFLYLFRYHVLLPQNVIELLDNLSLLLKWKADLTNINKSNGYCNVCNNALVTLKLKESEFKLLKDNVQAKLLIGSDIFLKTTPKELDRFMNVLNNSGPYDIVIDGLNVGYVLNQKSNAHVLKQVVEFFLERKKRILLIGRNHMLNWNKHEMKFILDNCHYFLGDNLSQDDPYLITAAIISGPETDILTNDLFSDHLFKMDHENLKLLFKRWIWQHQWRLNVSKHKTPKVEHPLSFTPLAQKLKDTWHLPLVPKEIASKQGKTNDGVPDLNSWLCIKMNENNDK